MTRWAFAASNTGSFDFSQVFEAVGAAVSVAKPTRLTYEEAAAIPDGSLLALSMLRPLEPLHGKSVLVYGAAGSIGTSAVQLLTHHFDAAVSAACDTEDLDLELVQSLGAQHVLDRFADFTKNGKTLPACDRPDVYAR